MNCPHRHSVRLARGSKYRSTAVDSSAQQPLAESGKSVSILVVRGIHETSTLDPPGCWFEFLSQCAELERMEAGPGLPRRRAYSNAREAVGEEIDMAVHCHNERDTPSGD